MDPISAVILIIGAVASIASIAANAAADEAAKGNHEKAQQMRNAIAQKYGAMALPHFDKVIAQRLGPSALVNMGIDPTGRQAQLQALEQFKQQANNDGMDPQAIAAYYKAQSEAGRLNSGIQGQLRQQNAQRGLLGSGADLAAQQQAAQQSLQRAAGMQVQAASDASERATQARQAMATLGTNMYSQDYTIARDRAMAQDAINKFNSEQEMQAAIENNNSAWRKWQAELAKMNGAAGIQTNIADAQDVEAERRRRAAYQQSADVANAVNNTAAGVGSAVKASNNYNVSPSDFQGGQQSVNLGNNGYGRSLLTQDDWNDFKRVYGGTY